MIMIFNMLKNKATVDTIGHGTVSPEQRDRNRYERETLLKIGLTPGYWTCSSTRKINSEKRLSQERFSTNYKTREAFEKDRITIADYILDGKYAPADLVQKVVETVKELDLQFGE